MNLEFLRKSRGFTLKDVQQITGIHYSVLSQIESGHRSPTRYHLLLLHRLFDELELELDDGNVARFEGVPEPPVARWKGGKADFSRLDANSDDDEELSEDEEDEDDNGGLFEDYGEEEEDLAVNLLDAKLIYKLQDALREKYPQESAIVVEHDDEYVIFVTQVGALYSLGYSLDGKEVTLSNEPPQPVLSRKRALNSAIRAARRREGMRVPAPLEG